MKARIVVLASALLAVGAVLAHPSHHGTPAERMERLAVLLDLDAQQKTAVEKILKDAHEQQRAAHQQARDGGERPTREALRERHQQLHQETLDKLSAVLNESQMQKFKLLAEHRQHQPPQQ